MKLSDKERSELFTELASHLGGKKQGGMAPWAYVNGGKEFLEKFFEKPEYHGQREVAFIPEIATTLARLPGFPQNDISLIDLGPGNRPEKTVAFMDAFNNAATNTWWSKRIDNRFKDYTAIDIVENYVDKACDTISKEFNLKAEDCHKQVNKYSEIKTLDTKGVRILIGWNAPIWNAPSHVEDIGHTSILENSLRQLAKMVGPGGYIVLNHYDEPSIFDVKTLEDVYNDPNCVSAVKAILDLIDKELKPECVLAADKGNAKAKKIKFADCFDVKIHFCHETSHIKMDILAKEDTHIKIGPTFVKDMSKGDSFTFVDAAKVSQQKINELASNANMGVVKTVQKDDIICTTLKVR